MNFIKKKLKGHKKDDEEEEYEKAVYEQSLHPQTGDQKMKNTEEWQFFQQLSMKVQDTVQKTQTTLNKLKDVRQDSFSEDKDPYDMDDELLSKDTSNDTKVPPYGTTRVLRAPPRPPPPAGDKPNPTADSEFGSDFSHSSSAKGPPRPPPPGHERSSDLSFNLDSSALHGTPSKNFGSPARPPPPSTGRQDYQHVAENYPVTSDTMMASNLSKNTSAAFSLLDEFGFKSDTSTTSNVQTNFQDLLFLDDKEETDPFDTSFVDVSNISTKGSLANKENNDTLSKASENNFNPFFSSAATTDDWMTASANISNAGSKAATNPFFTGMLDETKSEEIEEKCQSWSSHNPFGSDKNSVPINNVENDDFFGININPIPNKEISDTFQKSELSFINSLKQNSNDDLLKSDFIMDKSLEINGINNELAFTQNINPLDVSDAPPVTTDNSCFNDVWVIDRNVGNDFFSDEIISKTHMEADSPYEPTVVWDTDTTKSEISFPEENTMNQPLHEQISEQNIPNANNVDFFDSTDISTGKETVNFESESVFPVTEAKHEDTSFNETSNQDFSVSKNMDSMEFKSDDSESFEQKGIPQVVKTFDRENSNSQLPIEPFERKNCIPQPPAESFERKSSIPTPELIDRRSSIPQPPDSIERKSSIPQTPESIARKSSIPQPPESIARKSSIPQPPESIARKSSIPQPPESIAKKSSAPQPPVQSFGRKSSIPQPPIESFDRKNSITQSPIDSFDLKTNITQSSVEPFDRKNSIPQHEESQDRKSSIPQPPADIPNSFEFKAPESEGTFDMKETTESQFSADTFSKPFEDENEMNAFLFKVKASDQQQNLDFDAFAAKFDSVKESQGADAFDPFMSKRAPNLKKIKNESKGFGSMDEFDPFKVSRSDVESSRVLKKEISRDSFEDYDNEMDFSVVIKPKVKDVSDVRPITMEPPKLLPPPKTPTKAFETSAPRFNPFDKDFVDPSTVAPKHPVKTLDFTEVEDDHPVPALGEAGVHKADSVDTPLSPLFDEDTSLPLEVFPQPYNKEGWEMVLRQPNKKKLTGNRFWKKIFVKLSDNSVLQLFNKEDDKLPFQELPLQACYSLSEVGAQQYDQYGKIFTVKLQYKFYRERVGVRPGQISKVTQGQVTSMGDVAKLGLPLQHSPQTSQLLKIGSQYYKDIKLFIQEIEDALFRMVVHRDRVLTYKTEEVQVIAQDEFYVEQSKTGHIDKQLARVRIFFLAFITGMPSVEVGLNDINRQGKEVVGRYDIMPVVTEEWIRLEDCEFHSCVNQDEFQKNRIIKFHPPDACLFELLRFRIRPPKNRELPLQVRVFMTVSSTRVEIRSDILVPGYSSRKQGQVPCENIQIRFPVPECWIYLFRTEKHFRYGSKKSTARRPGKIKGLERIIGAAQNLDQSLIEVSAGQAKYEHVFHAVVWRIPRLPKEGQGAYTQQLFLLRTELTSFDQIPESFEQFVDVEFTMPATYVSHTTVRSVSVTNPTPPEKYVRYISKHEYKVQIEFKSSSDDIDGLMASPNVSIPVSTTPAVQESTEDEEKDDSD